jgi:hypothetical protein
MDVTFRVYLYRYAQAEPQAQYRGMVSKTISRELVLEAKTKARLNQMVEMAAVDGWRRDK